METENKENKEENIEEPDLNPQQQNKENPDNFSDQEIEDDFYKIQIENFKNKTTSNFHKNVKLVNEKGRVIKSAKFIDIRNKNFHEKKEDIKPKNEDTSNQPTNKAQNVLILNNSSGQVENSTTLLENNSAAVQKSAQFGTGSGEDGSGSGSGGDENVKKDEEENSDSEEENEESENEENKKINLPPPREQNEEILKYYERLRDNYNKTKILYVVMNMKIQMEIMKLILKGLN